MINQLNILYIYSFPSIYHVERPLRVYVRRVQRVGYSTLSVSLPKRWAAARGVGKGSLLYVYEMPDGSLVVRTSEEGERPVRLKALLRVSDVAEAELERSVIALYEAGYDVIRVVARGGLSAAISRAVKRALWRLSGIEVVEEGKDYVILEVVLSPQNLSFPKILDRMEVLVRSSLDDLEEYAAGEGRALLSSIVERDDELDKFYFLLVRQASTCFRSPRMAGELGLDLQLEVLPILYYGKTLERMGDTLTQLAMYASEYERRVELGLVRLMREAFSCAVSSFRRGDEKAMRRLTLTHHDYFRRSPRELLGDPVLSLTGNFLSLCMDAIDARVELSALKWPLMEFEKP